jgi:autotransporter-associated beta strand protein
LGGAFGNGTMTFSGNTTLVADSTLNIVNTGLVALSGPISGSGNLTKTGANTLVLQGTNTHTGYTEVQAGTLILRGGAAIADTSEVRVSGGTLDIFLTPNETVGSLVMSSGAITASSGGVSLTASSFSFTNSGNVSAQLVGGSAALTKSGSGTVSLQNTSGNTYGGGTIINAGTLVINNTTGSGTGTGAVTVDAGASLAGSGIISGSLGVSGALSPGNSGIGTISVTNDVTWTAGNAWVFKLGTSAGSLALAASGSSTQDKLLLTGTGSDFVRGTGPVWNFDFAGGGQMGWYELITWSGVTTFAATDFQATNLDSGLSGNLVFNGSSTGLYLVVVPEPSTVALALFALAIPLLRRFLRSRWA